jgi:hypothetical protein
MGGFKTPIQRELEILGRRLDKIEQRFDSLGSSDRAVPRAEVRGEWIPFNVNHNIRITLTDHGREALVKHWRLAYPDRPRAEQACDTCYPGWRSGPTVMQLWVAMQIFGPDTSHRGPNLFETAIEFEIDPYTTAAAHFTESPGTPDQPNPELQAYGSAYQSINRLERIGVYDYASLVSCLRAFIRQLDDQMAAADFTESPGTPDPPNPELQAYDSAYQSINRLERIGVYDYASLVSCLRANCKLVFGDDVALTDPQDMIQRMAAEVFQLRRHHETVIDEIATMVKNLPTKGDSNA